MPNSKMEKSELKGDVVLADSMDKVCHHLFLRDLCRVARVCKSWNAAVKLELQRRGMQKISLYENLYNLQFLYRFKVKPHIALLFATHQEFDEDDPSRPYPTASFQFISKYAERTILVGSSRLYTEKNFNIDHDKYDVDLCLNYHWRNEIPCLIIPTHDKLDVKSVWFSKAQVKKKAFKHRAAINPLLPKVKNTKTFLLLFTFGCETPFLRKTLNYIKESFQEKSYALWGSESFFPSLAINSKNNTPSVDQQSVDQQMGFVGISISSEKMECFSRIFFCEKMKISGFYQDLVKFKENVKLKQHNMAFINGPWFEDYYEDTSDEEGNKEFRKEQDEFYTDDYEQEYLYNFKKIFPNVPFISTFQNNMFKNFGVDMNGTNKFLLHEDAITIVIVTYN